MSGSQKGPLGLWLLANISAVHQQFTALPKGRQAFLRNTASDDVHAGYMMGFADAMRAVCDCIGDEGRDLIIEIPEVSPPPGGLS